MSSAASVYQSIIYKFLHLRLSTAVLSDSPLGFLTSFSQGVFFYAIIIEMKTSLRFLLLLFVCGLFFSCKNRPIQISGNATIHLNQDDEELAGIAENARDTLPLFFRHLLRPGEGEDGFRLKYPFRADSDSGFSMEQLWLEDIRFKDGVYYGLVANTPFYISAIKKGDIVSFSAGDITDWMYTDKGKIIGGFSIKYLLEQIPEHERSEEQRMVLKQFE
jgi:uncharacterized protein YegJ (DUF2314 family)